MDEDLMQKLAPVPRLVPLTPPLSPRAELALLCRLLFAEGYDDHIAGHVTLKQADGTILCNPWELAWDELKASDVITLDESGKVIDIGRVPTTVATKRRATLPKRPQRVTGRH
jgi:L-fuculose-phosphate aldolase